MDFLKAEGKEPVARDALTMHVGGRGKYRQTFLEYRLVGIGSRSHCLLGLELMRRTISSVVAG